MRYCEHFLHATETDHYRQETMPLIEDDHPVDSGVSAGIGFFNTGAAVDRNRVAVRCTVFFPDSAASGPATSQW